MRTEPTKRTRPMLAAIAWLTLASSLPAWGQWPQWGGPNRDFTVETSGLADSWPEGGPKKLWQRVLGTGYSSIVVDDGALYTMYRQSKTNNYEYTIALDAASGETIWRKRNLATIPRSTADHGKEFTGPNATPLIVADRLYTLGRNAMLHCYQKTDGAILWKHRLRKDFGAQIETCGYSCSPIPYGNTIIVPVGRTADDKSEGNSLVAFDQSTGDVVWRSQTFRINHSSPILINFEGEDQYVLCTKEALIGVNPANGELLWKHAYSSEQFAGIFATPLWNGKDTLFFSSREIGCAVRLLKGDSGTTVQQVWSDNKVPMGMGTPVLMGNMLLGSKRGGGVETPFLAVDAKTGSRLWLKRIFPTAVAIGGDGKLIILDHTGKLGLATVTTEGVTVHSQCQITERWSFTAPTLVGTTLYLRDEKHIMALDLG